MVISLAGGTAKADSSLLFGQKQAYSAIVRPDGKIITYAKLYLTNQGDNALQTTSFTLPAGLQASNLSVYQVTLPVRCLTSSPQPVNKPSEPYSYNNYYDTCSAIERQAFDIDGGGYYDDGSNSTNNQLVYKKIDLSKNANTYQLTLPQPIQPQKRGAYIVAYAADKGYVTSRFGVYHLNFKTLQVPDAVSEVRVAVDLSSDLYSKAGRSKISPGVNVAASSLVSGASQADSSASSSLDELQSGIGSGGVFNKTGKGLSPNESFTVTGSFADAAWKLHLWWYAGALLLLVAVVPITYILLKKANAIEAQRVEGK